MLSREQALDIAPKAPDGLVYSSKVVRAAFAAPEEQAEPERVPAAYLLRHDDDEEWPECPRCEDPACRPALDEPSCDWCGGKGFLDGDDLARMFRDWRLRVEAEGEAGEQPAPDPKPVRCRFCPQVVDNEKNRAYCESCQAYDPERERLLAVAERVRARCSCAALGVEEGCPVPEGVRPHEWLAELLSSPAPALDRTTCDGCTLSPGVNCWHVRAHPDVPCYDKHIAPSAPPGPHRSALLERLGKAAIDWAGDEDGLTDAEDRLHAAADALIQSDASPAPAERVYTQEEVGAIWAECDDRVMRAVGEARTQEQAKGREAVLAVTHISGKWMMLYEQAQAELAAQARQSSPPAGSPEVRRPARTGGRKMMPRPLINWDPEWQQSAFRSGRCDFAGRFFWVDACLTLAGTWWCRVQTASPKCRWELERDARWHRPRWVERGAQRQIMCLARRLRHTDRPAPGKEEGT